MRGFPLSDGLGLADEADGEVTMVSDGLSSFTRAVGMAVMTRDNGVGECCKRFWMIVDDGVVTHFDLEKPGEHGDRRRGVVWRPFQ